jgi:hemerythrin-like domain-containing protein
MTADSSPSTSSPPLASHGTLVQQTCAEHDALLNAMHQLEAALASAAPGRENAWNEQVVARLRTVEDALREHVVSADGPDGLLAEIDITRPTLMRRVEKLRQDHAALLEQVRELKKLAELRGGNATPDFQRIRQQATSLLNAMRHHQHMETDLIFETFYTDIGTVD